MSEKVSSDTLAFIRTSFTSIWSVELLLLMRRECSRWWTVGDLISELRASELIVKTILPDFVRGGLVAEAEGGLFQYRPVETGLDRLVSRVAAAYSENRTAVTEEILNAHNPNIRTFADAFRIRKK